MKLNPIRRRADGRLGLGRNLSAYVDYDDAWAGLYIEAGALYWCPVPFVVVKWTGLPARFAFASIALGLFALAALPGWWCVLFTLWLGWPGGVLAVRGALAEHRRMQAVRAARSDPDDEDLDDEIDLAGLSGERKE